MNSKELRRKFKLRSEGYASTQLPRASADSFRRHSRSATSRYELSGALRARAYARTDARAEMLEVIMKAWITAFAAHVRITALYRICTQQEVVD